MIFNGKQLTVFGCINTDTGNPELDTSGIPADIVAEAERVVSSMQTKQATMSSNVITFVAMTDMHELGDSDSTDSAIIERTRRANKNAGQAAKLISDKIGLDFFANLGDYAYGANNNKQTTTCHDLMQSIAAAKSYTAAVVNANTSIELAGNHDPLFDIKDASNAFITNDIITGLIGNYKYVDIHSKKVRVIGLHTAEYVAGSSRSEARMSGEQLQWFAQALDLSAKADAASWGIIILSHHPFGWSGLENAVGVLKSYIAGNPYSVTHNGVSVSYNFAGKNVATVIANFHGHVHCLNVGKIDDTDVPRIAIPNAYFYRNNEYGESGNLTFGESKTYNKNDNGEGKNTAFCLVSVDLTNKVIYADCFGAGYDRTVSYDGADITTYTITNNLSNATNSNGATTIAAGSPYVATITANKGYELESVTLTMGGREIAAVGQNGTISIGAVTGDIVITANAAATEVYDVTNLVAAATEVNGTALYNGKGYKDNCRISSSINEGSATGYVMTGQMPYAKKVNGNYPIIYIKGCTLDVNDSNCRWTGCPAGVNATTENCISLNGGATNAQLMFSTYFTIETLETGNYYKLTPIKEAFDARNTVGSMLMSLKGSGANLIITTDEEIK